ncbi:MAG: hypothetical protein WBE76_11105 [Terracidiphilus sp.]
MKHRIGVIALALVALCAAAIAQTAPNNDSWVGIWQGDTFGLPTGTMTLATDTGTLGGTLVLDIIQREDGQPRVIAQEPHVLVRPQVDGRKLSFDVRMQKRDGSVRVASFVVTRESDSKVSLHCVNCGPDAPVVEMAKNENSAR